MNSRYITTLHAVARVYSNTCDWSEFSSGTPVDWQAAARALTGLKIVFCTRQILTHIGRV